MDSTNNEFVLSLLALLDKQKSKSQINANIKELEQSIRKIKLTATLAKGNTKSELNQVIRQLESQLKQIKVQAKIDSRQLNREINNALRNVSARDINLNLNNTGDRLNAQVRRAVSQAREYVDRHPISINIDLKREKLLNQLAAFTNKHTKINESSYWLGEAERIRGVIEAVSNRNELRDATDQFQVFTTGVRATGYAAVSTTDRIKGMLGNIVKVGNYFGLAFLAVNKFRQSLNTLKTNDTILTEISKTSEMTKQQLKELGDEAFNVASKYGQVSGNYLTAVQEMARSGYEMMSKELGELSLLAQSAGDMTADMANNYLLATDAAYKYGGSVEKLNAALDGANYISNKNSASLTDIADATRVSASFAANAGVAIDELTAAEATMIAATKRSGSEMGRAFRSIILNLQQVSGEFDGEEINEEQLKKVEERCHSLGVELEYMKDGVATLRNPMEVLKELSEVYNSLPDNSADKQGLISDLGGKYHANALSALLSRWDMYEKMLGEFSQGTGSALEEANKTADSWEGRVAQLQNTWDSFVNSLTNKGAVKGGISFLDSTIQGFEKLTDTLGAIPVLLTTINGSMTALNKNYGITQIYNKDTRKIDLQGNFMGINITAYKEQAKHFREAARAIETWNNELNNGTADINTFGSAVVQNNKHFKDYLQTTSTEAPASLAGYRAYLNAAGISTDALRLKTVLLTTAMTMGFSFAIQLAVSSVTKLINAEKEAVKSAQEAAKTYGESSSSINDYISRYKELQEAFKSAKGNEQETYNVKKQLLELQTEINEKFSEAHGAVNLLTGDYESCTAAIQNLNKEAAQTFLNENMKGIRKAEEQMQKERHYVLDYSEHLGTEKGDAIKEIAEKYKDRGLYLYDETGDGSYAQFSVNIKADAQSAYETINDFQNELREKAKELGKEDLFSGIINISSSAINETKKVIDDYGDIFNQALTAEIASDDDKAVKYNEALEAVNAFNEAVLQSEDVYNDKNVDNVRQSLQEIKEELESSEEWEKYSSLIDDVFEQADTKLLDFNNHIKNDDSARKLAEDLEGLDNLDLSALDENVGENKSFDKLKESAESYGLSVEELIDTLVRLGYVQGEISNQEQSPYALSIDEAKKAVNGTDNVIGLIEEYELLQEVLSDTGNIQEETYEKLLSCSAKYATAIRIENGRITVNTSKLKAVAKSRQLDTKEAIKQTLALKKQEWVQWNNDIENYNGTLLDSITANYENIDSLQQQITQYELLVNSVDEASNAFKRFEAAQSVDEQDMFTAAQDAFNLVNETLNDPDSENYGKTNTKKFQLGIELLADDEDYKKLLNAESMEDYVRISKEIVKTLSPLFTENEGTGVDNLFKRADAIIDSGDIPKNDKEWADRLDTSVEIFQALKQRANLYEYNNREYFSSGFTNKLDEYQSRLSNVQSAQEALNECTDTTSKEYMRLSKELDDAKQKCAEFETETLNSLNEAYQAYMESGGSSKGSFSDYLKNTMDFDDNDITGSIDVMLEKAKTLEEQMMKIPSTSERYKELGSQLYEINQQLSSLGYSAPVETEAPDSGVKSLEEKLDEYKKLSELYEDYKKQLSTMDEGTSSYKHTEQELDRIQEKMLELGSPVRIEIQSNITEIDTEVSHLNDKISGLKESLKHASGSNEAYAIHMDIKGAENEKAKLEGQKADLEKKLKIIVDDTEAAEKTEAIQNEKIDDKKFEVNVTDNATSVLNKIENTKLSDKSLNVNVKVNNPDGINITGSGASGSAQNPKPKQAEADGTFHAFAHGTGSDVSIPKDEKALVNELGEEGLVRNGKLIPIRGGAQFINLKRGDIVFNHKEMEQLKKYGYTTGRGKLIGAHAEGTVNAYAGTDTYTKYNRGNVLLDWKSNPANPKNNPKKAAKEKEEETKEEKEQFEEIFDWIERRIKNFQRKFDKWLNQAETALTSGFITKYYKKAAKSLSKELKTYGKAYNRYMKEASSSRLSRKYKKKVKNGTIDIENIKDEKLADKIKKYQEYYDKAIDSTTSFVETAEKLYNLPLDKAAAKIEKFSDALDLLDKKMDNAIGSKAKNRLVDQQTIQKKNTLDANAAASREAQNNLAKAGANLLKSNTLKNSGVSAKEKKAIKNAVKNGTEINLAYFKEGSSGYNAAVKYNEALKANAQAVYDLQTAQEEYASWLVESAKIKFDNIADDYEKQIQMIGHQMTDLENKMSEIETRGKKVNKAYYESQRSINIQTIEQLKKERAELEQSLKGIKQGSDEWYDAYDKIKQIDSDISGKIRDNYDNVNKINQLYFDLF